jgi:hypothetical protein
MNNEYVQNLRYKLQKRVRRLNSTGHEVFHLVLRQFWIFVRSQPVLIGILDDLSHKCPSAEEDADNILSGQALIGINEVEQASMSLFVLQKCVQLPEDKGMIEVEIGHKYSRSAGKYEEALELFKDRFIEPLYDYLDEQLDDQRALLALLCRYKHKCEWFHRDDLLILWQSDTAKGERMLAYDLYEYLHDQGLDFSIEPTSASGKPDLISAQVGNEKLIADAKIFSDTTPKAYIAKAFHQVYQYTLDYNQPFGYLVIFKTCEDDLKFPMAGQEQSVPFLVQNNKTIFFVVIDICQHEATASKRGVLKTIEITEADLIHTAGADGVVTG